MISRRSGEKGACILIHSPGLIAPAQHTPFGLPGNDDNTLIKLGVRVCELNNFQNLGF